MYNYKRLQALVKYSKYWMPDYSGKLAKLLLIPGIVNPYTVPSNSIKPEGKTFTKSMHILF